MPASGRRIVYYFSIQSPWAYLGHARLLDIAGRHGATLDYRPVALAEVFSQSGGLPLARRHPARQAYRMVELQRWRAHLGLSFNLKPAFWPFEATRVNRAIVALVRLGLPPDPFAGAAFAGVWEQELDLADRGVIAHRLEANGFEPARVLAEAESDACADLYAADTRQALEAGAFGSPTYGLDGELFWGQDRLALLDDALASGRAPFRP